MVKYFNTILINQMLDLNTISRGFISIFGVSNSINKRAELNFGIRTPLNPPPPKKNKNKRYQIVTIQKRNKNKNKTRF